MSVDTTTAVVATAYGGPEVLELRELPLEPPGSNEVLLEVPLLLAVALPVRAAVISAVSPSGRAATSRLREITMETARQTRLCSAHRQPPGSSIDRAGRGL